MPGMRPNAGTCDASDGCALASEAAGKRVEIVVRHARDEVQHRMRPPGAGAGTVGLVVGGVPRELNELPAQRREGRKRRRAAYFGNLFEEREVVVEDTGELSIGADLGNDLAMVGEEDAVELLDLVERRLLPALGSP